MKEIRKCDTQKGLKDRQSQRSALLQPQQLTLMIRRGRASLSGDVTADPKVVHSLVLNATVVGMSMIDGYLAYRLKNRSTHENQLKYPTFFSYHEALTLMLLNNKIGLNHVRS